MDRRIVAGLAGVLAPTAFVSAVLTAGAVAPGFDPTRQAISESFATGAPTTPLMVAGLAGFALLAIPFARGVRADLRGGLPWTAAAILVDAGGTGLLLTVPCSPGCPGPGASTTDLLHLLVAAVAYAGHIGAPLIAWWELGRAGRRGGPLRGLAAVTGTVGLVGLIAWQAGLAAPYDGLLQRVFTMTVDVWFVAAGVALLTDAASSPTLTPARPDDDPT